MMMEKFLSGVIIMICLPLSAASAADNIRLVEQGNRYYKEKKYEEALKSYSAALSGLPDSAIVNFNAGAAQYKTGDYQKAVSFFTKALSTEDKGLEARANYNLGNSRYMSGIAVEGTDLSGAVQSVEGAVRNFERALELAPGDEDAKVNKEIAEKKLKELREKLQKSSAKPEEQGRSSEQQAQQQDQQQDTEQQQEKLPSQSDAAERADAQQQQDRQQTQEQSRQANEEQTAEGQPKEMSRQEAQMLLDGFREEERVGLLKDNRKGTEDIVEKDW